MSVHYVKLTITPGQLNNLKNIKAGDVVEQLEEIIDDMKLDDSKFEVIEEGDREEEPEPNEEPESDKNQGNEPVNIINEPVKPDNSAEIARLNEQLENKNAELQNINSNISKLNADNKDLQNKIDKSIKEMSNDTINNGVARLITINEVNEQINNVKNKLDDRESLSCILLIIVVMILIIGIAVFCVCMSKPGVKEIEEKDVKVSKTHEDVFKVKIQQGQDIFGI